MTEKKNYSNGKSLIFLMIPYIKVILIVVIAIGTLVYIIKQLPNILLSAGQIAGRSDLITAKNMDYFGNFPKNVSRAYYGN